jgi:hypothetical protein
MCTEKYKATTRSARCSYDLFSKWVRAKVSSSPRTKYPPWWDVILYSRKRRDSVTSRSFQSRSRPRLTCSSQAPHIAPAFEFLCNVPQGTLLRFRPRKYPPNGGIFYGRKRRDSNPRCGLPHTRFRVVRLQPTQPRFHF